jgi:hypothetical protein
MTPAIGLRVQFIRKWGVFTGPPLSLGLGGDRSSAPTQEDSSQHLQDREDSVYGDWSTRVRVGNPSRLFPSNVAVVEGPSRPVTRRSSPIVRSNEHPSGGGFVFPDFAAGRAPYIPGPGMGLTLGASSRVRPPPGFENLNPTEAGDSKEEL